VGLSRGLESFRKAIVSAGVDKADTLDFLPGVEVRMLLVLRETLPGLLASWIRAFSSLRLLLE